MTLPPPMPPFRHRCDDTDEDCRCEELYEREADRRLDAWKDGEGRGRRRDDDD